MARGYPGASPAADGCTRPGASGLPDEARRSRPRQSPRVTDTLVLILVSVSIDTIADLQKLITILQNRGYSESSVSKIMHGNFIRFLSNALP